MAKISSGVTAELKDYVESRFVIGPVAEKAFNEVDLPRYGTQSGPCEST